MWCYDCFSILIGNQRYFTSVACHPTEECVAVADNIGRVILYYDFLKTNSKSPHQVYHWHTLPVNDVIFSQAGKSKNQCVAIKFFPFINFILMF